jgi:catechol 2,3-dioxygenase-like lactoylglutathione lyase family enzyme
MRVHVSVVFVNDQARAHHFYTDVLGFTTKVDFPLGDHRWLTAVSPEDPDGTD